MKKNKWFLPLLCLGCLLISTQLKAQLTVTITSTTDVSCFSGCDGDATAAVTGGIPPYTYQWNTTPVQTTATATGLCAGTSTVMVFDSDTIQDTAFASVTITEPPALVTSVSSVDESCPGCCDGSATVIISGGTAPYTYLWDDALVQTTSVAIGLCAGIYCVTVADMNGCTINNCVTVSDSGCTLVVSTTSTDVTTCGGSDGTATATPNGGTSPYTYSWDNGQTTSTATGLSAGAYTITVTDSTGCITTSSAVVNEPAGVIASVSSTDESCTGCCDGTATVTASGGSLPYTYSWNTTPPQTTATATGLCAGSYCVVVTDALGCTTNSCVTVVDSSQTVPPIANFTCQTFMDTNFLCYVQFTDISLNNPTLWFWDFGDGNVSTIQNPIQVYSSPGSYFVVLFVTNAFGTDTAFNIVLIDSLGCSGSCSLLDSGLSVILGNVFNDQNANCIQDSGEFSLSNQFVKAEPGPYYGITNSNGNYKIYVDTGTYTVSQVLNNPYWAQVCPVTPNNYTITLTTPGDTSFNNNFGNQITVYCPNMSVDISTWVVRPCFYPYYFVNYCNHGTIDASNSTINVELDSNMSYSWGNGNLVSQNGNILTFDIGTVNPGQCGSFYFSVYVICDMSLVGSTMCVEAHVFPDSSCFPADSVWDKSSVEVVGNCTGDSLACFTITNTGNPGEGDMQGTSEYRIYENNILVHTGPFRIDGGNGLVICWPANGNTIRLEADQRPGHPGNSHPQDNVELCGGPPFITGQITLIPEDDENDFVEIDCHIATGSYDPNDKQVRPEGLTQAKYIDSTDVLEYVIQFQNTGTDTAFKIVIRDTLSAYVDITTIQPGASSHSYTLDIFGSDILQWTFENILLPDSNIDEPASHGFVKFKIQQQPGNIKGTVIENNAGIIFDFNEPVITNTVFNTIGNIDSITTSGLPKIYDNKISVSVYPNPFNSTTTFEIKGIDKTQPLTFSLYNIIGKQVRVISDITFPKFIIDRKNLPGGIYIYKLNSKNGLIGAGKLVVN